MLYHALNAHNHLDKSLLSALANPTAAGVYTVAYRLLDALFLPVQGLIFVLAPRLFARGRYGLAHTARWGRRFLPITVGWGFGVWGLSLALTHG
jgi:O-antigen/teichoic acid export membrane protein